MENQQVDNQSYNGPHGNAGLWGHFSVEKKGKKCYCGNKGCLEIYIRGEFSQ